MHGQGHDAVAREEAAFCTRTADVIGRRVVKLRPVRFLKTGIAHSMTWSVGREREGEGGRDGKRGQRLAITAQTVQRSYHLRPRFQSCRRRSPCAIATGRMRAWSDGWTGVGGARAGPARTSPGRRRPAGSSWETRWRWPRTRGTAPSGTTATRGAPPADKGRKGEESEADKTEEGGESEESEENVSERAWNGPICKPATRTLKAQGNDRVRARERCDQHDSAVSAR